MCVPTEPPDKPPAPRGMWAAVQAVALDGWAATLRFCLILVIIILLIVVLHVLGVAEIWDALT